jgi:hypothetical protein
MTDSTERRGAGDRTRVNMDQEHEVRYWTRKFNVSREALQKAVDAAGPMVSAVELELRGSSSSRS